jgi:uncharacterized protein (UPF0548 family)
MNVFGVRIGRLGAAARDRLLANAAGDDLTYDHLGSTLALDGLRPSVRVFARVLGCGDARFAAAVDAVRTWVPHRGIGARVHPAGQAVTLGSNVLIELRLGPLYVVAPDRIVAVTDEPARFGFTYGTLPGHAERGEETFLIERQTDGTVTATVRVDARPATLPARLAAPIVRRLQGIAAGRYLMAIADHVMTGDSP